MCRSYAVSQLDQREMRSRKAVVVRGRRLQGGPYFVGGNARRSAIAPICASPVNAAATGSRRRRRARKESHRRMQQVRACYSGTGVRRWRARVPATNVVRLGGDGTRGPKRCMRSHSQASSASSNGAQHRPAFGQHRAQQRGHLRGVDQMHGAAAVIGRQHLPRQRAMRAVAQAADLAGAGQQRSAFHFPPLVRKSKSASTST